MLPQKTGLSSDEAREKLDKYGKNILPEKPPPSNAQLLVAQLKSPLVYVLIAAGGVTFLIGHVADTIVLFAGVVLNTILGFFQEKKASNSLYSLKKLLHPKATVIRDQEKIVIEAEDVVLGDLCILGQGNKVPADGKVVSSNRLFVDESILTGESIPVKKQIGDDVFMGTIIASGQGELVVEKTGESTEIGKIAEKVQEVDEETPLRKQLKNFSKQLTILVIVLVVFVLVVGLLTGKEFEEILAASVALAVSSIPEGLLVALSVILAIGMQRILKRKGLVRNMMSAETLGGVTTICIDKTGTLTKGKMQVVDVVGREKDLAIQAILANDLDDPVVISAYSWASEELGRTRHSLNKYTRIDSIPFSTKHRFFASLNIWDDRTNMLFVNGAPEYLLNWSNVESKEKEILLAEIKTLTSSGKRVIGLARKKVSKRKKKVLIKDVKSDLEWVGIIAFSDPVRPGVKDAFKRTRRAGVNLLVITGDYSETATSVMKQLGMQVNDNSAVLGKSLKDMSVNTLAKKLKDRNYIKLFARTTPEQKLKIVEALKKNNEIVAMMGDGVNDAPALRHADIGIVVGEATDVAKETADLVLLDSSFETIVAAIEEGRGIFDNIRKIILYLMSDAFEEIITIVGALVLGFPLPVTAVQILWINLISDGLPDLALTVDPKAEGIMERPPRDPEERIVNKWMKVLIILISTVGGIIALSLFAYYYNTTNDEVLARSVAFASLGVNSLIFVFSVRTLTKPFWRENPFSNPWLNLAVIGGLVLQFSPFVIDGLGRFLGIVYPGTEAIILVFLASILTFIIIEVAKSIIRRRLEWFQH